MSDHPGRRTATRFARPCRLGRARGVSAIVIVCLSVPVLAGIPALASAQPQAQAPARAQTSARTESPARPEAPSRSEAPPRAELPVRFQQAGQGLADFLVGLPPTPSTRAWTPEDRAGLARLLEATRRHPDYGAALARLEGASGLVTESRAARLPQVSSGSTLGDRRVNGIEANGQRANVGVSQLLYDFGKSGGLIDSAEGRRRAAEIRLAGEESALALRGLLAWAELFRARQQLQLQQLNVSSRAEIADVVQERAELGGGTTTDVLRARARQVDAEAGVSQAEARVAQAEAAWRNFFQAPPPQRLDAPPPLPGDAAPEESRIPELAQALFTVREATALKDSSRREADAFNAATLPQVNVEASVAQPRDSGLPHDRSLLLTLRYNLYAGGAETARAAQARARAQESAQTAESSLREAELSIRQALADVQRGERGVPVRRRSIEVAAETLASVREQFAYRRGTLLDLLRAQEDLFFTGRDYLDAITDHSIARYRLAFFTGRLMPALGDAGAPAR